MQLTKISVEAETQVSHPKKDVNNTTKQSIFEAHWMGQG